MAQTNIFVGNISGGVVDIFGIPLYPNQYISLQDKFSLSKILHDTALTEALALGVVAIKVGGLDWTDATAALYMSEVYASLTEDEKSLATGLSIIIPRP